MNPLKEQLIDLQKIEAENISIEEINKLKITQPEKVLELEKTEELKTRIEELKQELLYKDYFKEEINCDKWKYAKEKANEYANWKRELIFPICNNFTAEIKISSRRETRQALILAKSYENKKTKNIETYFLDDPIDSKTEKQKIVCDYTRNVFECTTRINDNEILLYSDKRIPQDNAIIKIKGTYLELSDKRKAGEKTEIDKKLRIILVNEVVPTEVKVKAIQEQLSKVRTLEDLKEKYFTESARQPEFMENLILAWNACTYKAYGYPIHLALIDYDMAETQAQGGIGKTWLLSRIKNANQLEKPIYSARISTLKGLAPSYSGKTVKLGYLLENRIGLIDEFLKTIEDKEENAKTFDLLKEILENQERLLASGNTEDAVGFPEVKTIFCANQEPLKSKLEDLMKTTGSPFAERLVPYFYTQKYRRFIQERKEKTQLDTNGKQYDSFKELMEFLGKTYIKLTEENKEKIKQIYKEGIESYRNEYVKSYYEARMLHHIVVIMDGIIKINNLPKIEELLIETKGELKEIDIQPTENEFNQLKEIIKEVVYSW